MAKPALEMGATIDGFLIEERVHRAAWRRCGASRARAMTLPLLMKVPKIGEGADPAAIVSFEMEQMIMPRLAGVHVPNFVAAGDFAVQPYIVMERFPGRPLLPRLPRTAVAL